MIADIPPLEPRVFPLSSDVLEQYRRLAMDLWRSGIGPVTVAVPMPPRSLESAPFATALQQLGGYLSPLDEVMSHMQESGPSVTVAKLVASKMFSASHIQLGCGLMVIPWLTSNTMGKLHSPRLVGVLAYAPKMHPAWPAAFKPSPSSTRSIMSHLAKHIGSTAGIKMEIKGKWDKIPLNKLWSDLLNVSIPPARFDTAETAFACQSLNNGLDALAALDMLPLASFSVTSPSASPKVLRSLFAAGGSVAVASILREQLLGEFLIAPTDAACSGRALAARSFCAALMADARRLPAAEQRVTFVRMVGDRIGLLAAELSPPSRPTVAELSAEMHASKLYLRGTEWQPPPSVLTSGMLAPQELVEALARDLLKRFPLVTDEYLDPRALVLNCWEHARAQALLTVPFDPPDLSHWNDWYPAHEGLSRRVPD
jgi:hypothetical protein